MANEYLDKQGLEYLWEKIKAYVNAHGGGFDLDSVYPVGSIYMSVNSTSPSVLFGGTWERLKDSFLLSAGDTYTAGDTGGEATHTLTEPELPVVEGHFSLRRFGTSTAQLVQNSGSADTNTMRVTHDQSYADSTGVGVASSGGSAQTNQKISMTFGQGNAHNNLPPYLVVYMWKRVADAMTELVDSNGDILIDSNGDIIGIEEI